MKKKWRFSSCSAKLRNRKPDKYW